MTNKKIKEAIERNIYQSDFLTLLRNNCQQIREEIFYDDKERTNLSHGDVSIKSNSISGGSGVRYIAIIELVLEISKERLYRAEQEGLDDGEIIRTLGIGRDLRIFSKKLELFFLKGMEAAASFDYNYLSGNEEFHCFSCCANKTFNIGEGDLDLFNIIREMKNYLENNNWRAGTKLLLVSLDDKREFLQGLMDFEHWIRIREPHIYCLIKYWENANQEITYPFKLLVSPLRIYTDNQHGLTQLVWCGTLEIANKYSICCAEKS